MSLVAPTRDDLRRALKWGPRVALDLYRTACSSVPVSVKVPGLAHSVYLRPGTTDADVFYQIYLRREYDVGRFPQFMRLAAHAKRPLIIDCGAYTGLSTVWFAALFPEGKIVAVEPDPENFEMLRRNTETLPQVRALNAGVWDHTTQLGLLNPEGKHWAIFLSETGAPEVPAVTIPQIISEAGDHDALIVKIDIEGGEHALFRSNTDWLAAADLVAIEIHDWLLPWQRTTRTLFQAIAKYDFDVIVNSETLFFFRVPRDPDRQPRLGTAAAAPQNCPSVIEVQIR